MQKHKKKMRSEERASGLDPEMTEIDTMLEELWEKEEVAEEEDDTKKKKAEAEKESAEKMRLKAMEKLSESQKRKESNEEVRPKKSRKSIGDAVSYLQEKSKQEIALRKEETDLKNQEEGRIAHLSEKQLKMQQDMLQMIQQQHQNQQRLQQEQQRQQERLQQQQLQTMQFTLTQQQQQSQAMLALFEKCATKKDPWTNMIVDCKKVFCCTWLIFWKQNSSVMLYGCSVTVHFYKLLLKIKSGCCFLCLTLRHLFSMIFIVLNIFVISLTSRCFTYWYTVRRFSSLVLQGNNVWLWTFITTVRAEFPVNRFL